MAGQIAELAAPHAASATSARINTRAGPRHPARRGAARCCRRSARSSARRPRRELEKLGVEVLLGAMVTDVDERGIDGARTRTARVERIEAVTKIWAAGVQASPLGRTLAEQTGAAARPRRPDRRQPRPHAARPPRGVRRRRHDRPRQPPRRRPGRDPGREVRRQGRSTRRLDGKAPQPPFKYFDKGSMATISPVPRGRDDRQAPAHRLRRLADVARPSTSSTSPASRTGSPRCCTGRSRFLGRGRSERTTTEQQIFGRLAMDGRADGELPSIPDRPGRRRGQRRRPSSRTGTAPQA